jgi:hypothetical protein
MCGSIVEGIVMICSANCNNTSNLENHGTVTEYNIVDSFELWFNMHYYFGCRNGYKSLND